jgi:hypothetical protein
MELVIELSPEVEDRVKDEAQRRSLTSEEYARQITQEKVGLTPASKEPIPQWEREREFLALVEDLKTLPQLSPEAFERSSYYEDRG